MPAARRRTMVQRPVLVKGPLTADERVRINAILRLLSAPSVAARVARAIRLGPGADRRPADAA